ncbi:MAG: squalene synthase HpnD [Betaproteobacteria bacterium TMED41]|nr:MAG: squalene synthase HpnD [Betaproteobacteria bacterium TMED41]
MSPEEYCHDKVARSGSNFVGAFALLGKEQRSSIEAVYAFCREIDDIADECSDRDLARLKLSWWKNEVEKNFTTSSNHPVLRALKNPIEKFSLPKNDFLAVVDGVMMDLSQKPFTNWTELNSYCDKVAGAVGRLSTRIFGPVNDQILEYASLLGRACQYTNILRDIGEDAKKQRYYLPISLLEKYGFNTTTITLGDISNFKKMCEEMASINHNLYEEAFQILPKKDYSKQRAGIVMGVIYRGLLRTIENSHYEVLENKISLTPIRKFWIAWKASWGSIPR